MNQNIFQPIILFDEKSKFSVGFLMITTGEFVNNRYCNDPADRPVSVALVERNVNFSLDNKYCRSISAPI